MITAKFIQPQEILQSALKTIDVCKKTVLGTPNYQVAVYLNNKPVYLLNIYLFDEPDCFHDLKYSDSFVIVGSGEKVHFFCIEKESIKSYSLGNYFGHMYPSHDIDSNNIIDKIFIASASKLYLFSQSGKLVWESDVLGIDGVIINDIKDDLILGSGEYDPPGGWEDFVVKVNDGKSVI